MSLANNISTYAWGALRFFLILWFLPKVYLALEGRGFEWLLSMVASWSYTAGYEVIEMGDDVHQLANDKALMLINHQSTSDVPLIMAALDGRTRNVMWIMDRMFLKTNFGLVSWFHKDFFISSGKHRRDQSLRELTSHLTQAYLPCERTWILLFPEGGFLHKRREVSTKFAMKNNLPVLQHTTIPRVGAVQNIVATIGPEKNKLLSNGNADVSNNNPADKCLKWIIDLTVAYPNGKPLDITNIFFASAPPCNTVFHYRCYPVSELPTDNEELKQWVYDRYIEKDAMLAKYYETGKFPDHRRPGEFCQPRLVLHDGTRMALLHLLYITSTLFHCCLLKTLFSYAVSFL